MKDHFKINKTMYIILVAVFIFGMVVEISRSSYVLQFHSFSDDRTHIDPIPLPEDLTSTLSQDTYLVIKNTESEDSEKIKTNVIQTLHYMQKLVDERSVSSIPEDLTKYTGIIITFEEIDKLTDLRKIEAYVEEGGSVFFAIRPGMNDALYRLYRKLGIYDPGTFTEAKGINMTSNLLIQNKGLKIDNGVIVNSSLAVGLEPSCNIFMKSMDNIPLLWEVPYKKGRFVVFNGTMLSSKENRGLIVGAVGKMKDEFIYPILNMKLAFIDDFPAPFPDGIDDQIYTNYGLDIKSFFRDVWWPSIQKGASKYDVTYAGVMIQTYNDRVEPPFDISKRGQFSTIKYGRELLKMGGEIGIHGYNHQSLTTQKELVSGLGYNVWDSIGDMSASLEQVNQYANEAFPDVPMETYVPPSNIIDDSGLEAIASGIPSIKIISSLYGEDPENQAFIQEFSAEGRFVHLPRITSGYEYNDSKKWAIANAMSSIGVFSHFVHPDDVLDEERSSSKSWEELSKEYNRMLSSLKEKYPWLRSRTPSEAGRMLLQLSNTTIYTEKKGNKLFVYIDQFPGEVYFILRTEGKIKSVKDCTVEKIDKGVYLVTGKKEILEIGLGD